MTSPARGCCDKCGMPVEPGNDAVMLDLLISGALGLVTTPARHLLPVGDCPGSPSRAQYLPGQPHDPRYPYDADHEARVRTAYAKMMSAA